MILFKILALRMAASYIIIRKKTNVPVVLTFRGKEAFPAVLSQGVLNSH